MQVQDKKFHVCETYLDSGQCHKYEDMSYTFAVSILMEVHTYAATNLGHPKAMQEAEKNLPGLIKWFADPSGMYACVIGGTHYLIVCID